MTELTGRRRTPARLDPIAAAWGGLVASVGLMVAAGNGWPLRLALTGMAFLVAGFLAGVRARGRRGLHAAAAAAVGHVLHAAYIALARLLDAIGGPSAPALTSGGAGSWLLAALWGLLLALVGAALANWWLRPAGGGRRLA